MNLTGTWILTYITRGTVAGAGVLSVTDNAFVGGDSAALITGTLSTDTGNTVTTTFNLKQHTKQPWANLLIPEGSYTIQGGYVNDAIEFPVTPELKVTLRRP